MRKDIESFLVRKVKIESNNNENEPIEMIKMNPEVAQFKIESENIDLDIESVSLTLPNIASVKSIIKQTIDSKKADLLLTKASQCLSSSILKSTLDNNWISNDLMNYYISQMCRLLKPGKFRYFDSSFFNSLETTSQRRSSELGYRFNSI